VSLGRCALTVAVAGVLLAAPGCAGDAEQDEHAEAVAVAAAYLDAFADADVEALCATYTSASQQAAFATYDDVDDCAAYAAAHTADPESGYRVTRHMEADFETGEAAGDDQRVEVGFTGEVTYTGDVQEAVDHYEEHPTVSGTVVVVRDGGAWRVDAAATEETF
jgi:hypothetical protein